MSPHSNALLKRDASCYVGEITCITHTIIVYTDTYRGEAN